MSYQNLQFERADGVARLVLSRPEKMNSFTGAMHEELLHALGEVEADRGVHVLVLTGAGRAFCAGQDLADPEVAFQPGGPVPDLSVVITRRYVPLVRRLTSLRVPTIAAVGGVAAGAGASLALACDLVVAAKSASFLQAFSKIGLVPDSGGTWFLPQRVGMARALGLAMLADKLSATQAAEWGLIWQAVDDAEFPAAVSALAKRVAELPTAALVRIRQALRAAPTNTLEQQLALEARLQSELGAGPDYAEGVAAFLAKRAPRFNQG